MTFSSQFDSGNLRNCLVKEDTPGKHEFNLFISGDSVPYEKAHYKTWFYFSIKGMPADSVIRFTIRNMGNQGKLIKNGLRPVYRSLSNQKWKRVHDQVNYKNEKGYSTLSWTHDFSDMEKNDIFFFAYTYPYSYTESLIKTKKVISRVQKANSAYIHREVLCHSLEGREMEMITLSSFKGITEQRECPIEEPSCLPFKQLVPRPFMFENKKTIFLTSRVHPGETPASYVLNGILNFLTSKSQLNCA